MLSNYSCLNRILRTIILVFIATILVVVIPMSKSFAIFIMLTIIFGGMLIADRFLRKVYSDWPHSKNFEGSIIFTEKQIEINREDSSCSLRLSDCSELLFFTDHFAGYTVNNRDLQRNGNALIFLKKLDGETLTFKFNIHTEEEYKSFCEIKSCYPDKINYYKEYGTPELMHILNSELTNRIKYR